MTLSGPAEFGVVAHGWSGITPLNVLGVVGETDVEVLTLSGASGLEPGDLVVMMDGGSGAVAAFVLGPLRMSPRLPYMPTPGPP